MATRGLLPAVKRLGSHFGSGAWQRRMPCLSAINSLSSPEASAVSQEFASLGRQFRSSVLQLDAAEPHLYSRPSDTGAEGPARQATDSAPQSSPIEKRKSGRTFGRAKPQERPVVFECTHCEALCVKRVLQDPFDRGVVVVRCLECRGLNLVSDELGLFKEPGSMKGFLAERGVDLWNGPESSYELLPEDLAEIFERSKAQASTTS